MSVYIDPKNPDYVIIDCRPDGYKGQRTRDRFPLDTVTFEAAQQMHDDMMRRPTKNYAPPINTTIAGIYKQWIVFYRNNRAKSTADDAESCWKHLKQDFGVLFPKNITEAQIETYKSRVIKITSPRKIGHRTITKHLSYLSSMLKWAAKMKLCSPLPFAIEGFDSSKTTAPKPRPISQEQISKIYAAIDDKYKLVFLLMADAGLRRNEALHLERNNIEWDSQLIFLYGKGSKERIVPITTERLRLEVEKRLDAKGYLAFNPSTKKPYLSIRKALMRATEKAGVDKHVHHHLLRHSFGTNATTSGMDLNSIQVMMGHASSDTTRIYQHLAGDYLREQAKKLQSRVHVDKKKAPDDSTSSA